MNVKKILIGIILIVVVTVGYFMINNQKTQSRPLTIAAILPLSGDYAAIGKDIKNGIEAAYFNAVENGTINDSEVIIKFEDGQINARKTITAYNKIKSTDNLVAVIAVTSNSILSLKPLAQKDKIVLINASATSPEINDADDYTFSVIPDAKLEAEFLATYLIKDLNKKNFFTLYRNDQSGIGFNTFFTEKIKELGGNVVITETHEPNTTDFKSIIIKLKTGDSDGIFMGSFGNETAQFAKQSKELGFEIPIFTYEAFNQPKAISLAGKEISRIQFVSPNTDMETQEVIRLKELIKSKYGNENMNYYIISHYNALNLILQSISKGNTTGVKLKESLSKTNSFKSIGGIISFNQYGGALVELSINGFERGKPTKIK